MLLALDSFTVDPAVLSILLGVVIPVITGVVTKEVAHAGLKATVLLFLSGLTGVLASAQTNDSVISKQTLIFAAVAWAVGVATHFGWLKPTGVSDAVQSKTSNIGIGKSS